jgi:hypothetical protein
MQKENTKDIFDFIVFSGGAFGADIDKEKTNKKLNTYINSLQAQHDNEIELIKINVGFLRQWLNEKPKGLLVTNEHIEKFLFTDRILKEMPNDKASI